ncbi:EVE domain-containing protein [Solwaraspora sp. WMMB335]|uniref:EVE domain-containing protein n=1 Tax=Solwaraspora sp. WMMB335 TaxID=3404118 RepID=UPI003B92622F
MAQWVLQCNPERWQIHDFFASGQQLGSWSITRYASEIASGDQFALWVSGKNAGVVGLGEVAGSPTEEDPDDAADGVQWAVAPGRGHRRWLLPITLTSNFIDDAVPKAELAADPQFADSAIIRQPMAGSPFRVTDTEWAALLRHVGDRGAAPFVPPEATAGAADLLRRLIGQLLPTVSGRTNTILEVQPPHVKVATSRSPQGQQVPIAWVDDALTRLVEERSVEIHPRAVGHRSAFIGAVLLTLPGARATGSPPVVRLAAPDEDSAAVGDFTFEGDLRRVGTAEHRGEQASLRRRLFGSAAEANCALCGQRYPVRFLWAAHIKKRAACSDDELRDLDNIAMPACLFGCDALFEAGYIAVGDDGCVIAADDADAGIALAERLDLLAGKKIVEYALASAGYFRWHRENIFRG